MSSEEETKETYPCFIRVTDDESNASENCIELPSEKDGTMLLSTIQAQFPSAIGLKYKTSSGSWRGIRISDNVLDPPFEGWRDAVYNITLPKTDSVKRKMEESPNREPEAKLVKTNKDDYLSDLIVLGLPYKATEDDMRDYFEQFGELSMVEVKMDPKTRESRGFGFIRYKNASSAQDAVKQVHTILGRRCEVRLPKRKDEMPLKLFIGRLPADTTKDELTDYFEKYGELTDVYIPSPFRGFGFVTFAHSDVARRVLNMSHILKSSRLNVTYAEPKGFDSHAMSGGMRGSNSRGYARGDPPFNFDDMRQIMSRSSYSPMYAPSRSSRRYDPRGYSSGGSSLYESRSGYSLDDSRSTTLPYGAMGIESRSPSIKEHPALYKESVRASPGLPQSTTEDRIHYGFWSDPK